MPSPLVIRNIAELLVVPPGPIAGRRMRLVPTMASAAMILDGGRIAWFGPEADLAVPVPAGARTLDAEGGCVIPGLIDCHTHAVFAGTREGEFVQRIEGRSYAEIAEAGGGIRVTVDSVRRASVEELVDLARPRLARMLANGVTTVEIKSGYGLSVADELKMLEAIRRSGGDAPSGGRGSCRAAAGEQPSPPNEPLPYGRGSVSDGAAHGSASTRTHATHATPAPPIEIVATYLAAHTVPREFAGRPDDYLDTVFSEDVLARIQRENLAEFCDVFCEKTAFTVEQSRRVLLAAKRFGMTPKVHADQITPMGASRLAAEIGAVSADHLEHIDDAAIAAMKAAGTVAVLLPACSFFLGVPQAPARRLMDADLPVAVATDYNPGSAMVESLPLTLSIACTQMRMTPTEAIVAATANAAAALRREGRLGAIAVGMQADLVVLDVGNHQRFLYEVGRNCVRSVIKHGEVVWNV